MLTAESTESIRERARSLAAAHRPAPVFGRVERIAAHLVEAAMPSARIGDLIEVESTRGGAAVCEVVGLRGEIAQAIPLGQTGGVALGARASLRPDLREFPLCEAMFGRVLDAFGQPLDGGPDLLAEAHVALEGLPPTLSERAQVDVRFDTGIRVIDGLLSCGRGQRIGIFAGAGIGKSTLIEQIARQSEADVVVVGLIGERGREVRELASSQRSDRMAIIAATSDRSAMERIRGARAATAAADHFARSGKTVLLLIDSLTRYAMALREVGLALGEPAATKGYTPSVFAELPRLLERVAPYASGGSTTAFYSVLVEGDDLSDPVADASRALLDGHIVLDRELAGRGQFPAIDVVASTSRVFDRVATVDNRKVAGAARVAIAGARDVAELVALGAYVPGVNPAHDRALELGSRLSVWASQAADETSPYEETMSALGAALSEDSIE